MAMRNAHIYRFSAGEVSSAALARVDQDRVALNAEIQENILPHAIGKGLFRPGSQYLGSTHNNARARFFKFIKSRNDTALVECTTGKVRVWVDDAVITRPAVTTTITNGDLSIPDDGSIFGDVGWTQTESADGAVTITVGRMAFACPSAGGQASAKQQVTVATASTEHAIRVEVERGPIIFRVGSTDGGDDYIAETNLDAGTHSLAFTPTTATFWVELISKDALEKRVTSVTIEAAGIMTLDAPWTETHLREMTYDRSGDILFLAHDAWRQRKIERRGTRSWSIVKYHVDDGPFTLAATADVALTPGALTGNTTLTADRAFFKTSHVGALFRLFHEGQNVSTAIAAAGQFSDTIRVTGIDADRVFNYALTGTWVGTITLQRSYDSADEGFIDVSTRTANVDTILNDTFDNQIVWYRMGFKPGDYTSGTATVALSHDSGGGRGICRVVGYTSATEVEIEVLDPFQATSATRNWREGEWSDRRGWPSAVRFYDGRLFYGGRDKIWGSVSDAYYSFDEDVVGDSGSIQRNVATGGSVEEVRWMLPLQRLIFGTEGAEVSARSSAFDEPLTPTNVTLKDASTQGVDHVSPVKMDSRGVFVQASGERTYQIVYSVENNDYSTSPLMRMHEDIGEGGIVHLDIQRQPENYIWHVRADGECPILILDPAQEVSGWIRYITAPTSAGAGVVEDVCVMPGNAQDVVYLSIQRTVDGSTVRYLERLATHKQARGGAISKLSDAHVYVAGPVTTVTGLDHLEGETVAAWGNGKPLGTYTVASGEITLSESATDVCVGLGYDWRYKSSRLAYGAQMGTALLQAKRVSDIGLLLENFHFDAVQYGSDFTTMYELERTRDGQAVDLDTTQTVHDDFAFPFGGDWDTDARVCLKGSSPYPVTLLGLVVGVTTNED